LLLSKFWNIIAKTSLTLIVITKGYLNTIGYIRFIICLDTSIWHFYCQFFINCTICSPTILSILTHDYILFFWFYLLTFEERIDVNFWTLILEIIFNGLRSALEKASLVFYFWQIFFILMVFNKYPTVVVSFYVILYFFIFYFIYLSNVFLFHTEILYLFILYSYIYTLINIGEKVFTYFNAKVKQVLFIF